MGGLVEYVANSILLEYSTWNTPLLAIGVAKSNPRKSHLYKTNATRVDNH